jgi:S1-C subfamily serine protease
MIVVEVQSVAAPTDERPMLGVVAVKNAADCKIERLVPNSSAQRAGLQQGDIIVRIDNQVITDFADLTRVVQSKRVGQTVGVTIRRQGQELTRQVELQPAPQ